MIDAYHRLANAIVIHAAKEYIKEYKKYLRRPAAGYPDSLIELEQFFNSEWYGMLTDVDGKWLLTNLRKQAENGKRRKRA